MLNRRSFFAHAGVATGGGLVGYAAGKRGRGQAVTTARYHGDDILGAGASAPAWYRYKFIGQPVMDAQLLFWLGNAPMGLTDVGEVLDTDPRLARATRTALDLHDRALRLRGYDSRQVDIPYQGSVLYGRVHYAPGVDRGPVLVLHQGLHAWPEDTMWVIDGALARGYVSTGCDRLLSRGRSRVSEHAQPNALRIGIVTGIRGSTCQGTRDRLSEIVTCRHGCRAAPAVGKATYHGPLITARLHRADTPKAFANLIHPGRTIRLSD